MQTIDGGFLQSKHWKKFQKSLGRDVFSFGDGENFHSNMIRHNLPIVGGYFFVPRGPLQSEKEKGKRKKVERYLLEMIDKAKEEKLGWVRVEPQSEKGLELIKKVLKFLGEKYEIKKSKKNHQPPQTLMIDLLQTEEEILMAMKSKTRYNIRLSERKGVKVFAKRGKKAVEKFLELSKITAKRDGIVLHPDEYYRKMIEIIPEENLKLYFAKIDDEIISTVMIAFYGGVATYLHGASGNSHRNVMAPQLLQWKAIKEAKKEGCKKYDFGGVKIDENEKNSWAGITKFKTGFCPKNEPINFPGCYDIIVDPFKYKTYQILQGILDFKNKLTK